MTEKKRKITKIKNIVCQKCLKNEQRSKMKHYGRISEKIITK